MTILNNVSISVQKISEAIALALGVVVEIVDDEFSIVGGTDIYKDKIGKKEEAEEENGNYLYARVLRSGKTEFIADAPRDSSYAPMVDGVIRPELAEVCTPIIYNNEILGIIGLIAINPQQRELLITKRKSMIVFVEKMAELLSAKAVQGQLLKNTESRFNEVKTILETVDEGIITIDQLGIITQCNPAAEELMHAGKNDLIGSHLSKFLLSSPALNVIKTEQCYVASEELYNTERGSLHFLVTAKPFFSRGSVAGVVIMLKDIEDVQKLVYNMNTGALKYTFDDIMGESEAIAKTKNRALTIARGNSTVLITGESGTGKEMFAKAIHYASSRAKNTFVTVNCGAIPENLLESELFGYEKGAFTGASEKGKIGKFELADGGTIFLDEIGDMPLHLQVKLLHVLQNMRFERVGGNKTIAVDVRVVSATNRNLEEMVNEGSFRADLYFRLSVIPLSIPPLRDRKDDTKVLMLHFLRKYNSYMGANIQGFTKEAEEIFLNHSWYGNVRELENAIEYGVNMCSGSKIDVDAIPERLFNNKLEATDTIDSQLPLGDQVKIYEKEIIERKLKEYGSSNHAKEKVAKELGLSRATLYRKLAELDL